MKLKRGKVLPRAKRGDIVFFKHDMFPYVRWMLVRGHLPVKHGSSYSGWLEGNMLYALRARDRRIAGHASAICSMPRAKAQPIIESLELLTKMEYAGRQAVQLGFREKLYSIAPFMRKADV